MKEMVQPLKPRSEVRTHSPIFVFLLLWSAPSRVAGSDRWHSVALTLKNQIHIPGLSLILTNKEDMSMRDKNRGWARLGWDAAPGAFGLITVTATLKSSSHLTLMDIGQRHHSVFIETPSPWPLDTTPSSHCPPPFRLNLSTEPLHCYCPPVDLI